MVVDLSSSFHLLMFFCLGRFSAMQIQTLKADTSSTIPHLAAHRRALKFGGAQKSTYSIEKP